MKYIKRKELLESAPSGTLVLNKNRVIFLLRLIVSSEIKEINNSAGKLEVVYYKDNVDISSLFPHMKKASFEYKTTLNSHWAEAEIKAWDPYEINDRKVYVLNTGKYKRNTPEYQSIVHIFMKHMIDSGRPIKY